MTVALDARRAARFPGLDAVRALGAAAVVATHCGFWTGRSIHGPFSGVLARMDLGVALFFVLSGFLLFRPYAVAHEEGTAWPATRTYLVRRALRILPAYWLVVAVALLTVHSNRTLNGPLYWLRDLTLTQIYGLDWGSAAGLTQTWSLATEVAFYLLLPVLATLVLRRLPRPELGFAALAVVPVAWSVYIAAPGGLDPRVAGLWLPGYVHWFAAGMLLALVQVRSQLRPLSGWMRSLQELALSPATCWTTAVALVAVATSAVAGPQDLTTLTSGQQITKDLLYGAIALLVALPLTLGLGREHGLLDVLLDNRVVHWLGEISYGVFLWHLLVLQAVTDVRGQRLFTGSWTVTFALVWGLSLVVASLSYVLLERPLLRLKDRIRRTSPSTGEQVAARPMTQSA